MASRLMRFRPASLAAILLAAAWAPLCAAQRESVTSAPASSASSSSVPPKTHTISVGIDHKFKPEVTQAEIGDTLDFRFVPVNHSVVRAEYEFPCIPYEMTGRGKTGFFSGFHPVDAILEDAPSWTIKVNDTDPMFLYCSAPGSCITWGMVAVINPNANVSLEKQRTMAKDSAFMLNPGEPFPPEGTPSALATLIGPASTAPASTSTSAPPAESGGGGGGGGLSKGAIAGIAVAGAAILALAAALFFYIGRSRSMKQELKRNTTTLPPPSSSPYQHHSFLAPKTEMTDQSSRNSAIHHPQYASYDGSGTYGIPGHGDPKNEYFMHAESINNVRSEMASPASNGGEFQPQHEQTYSSTRSSGAPQRYPSLAINPNQPREMDTSNT